MSVIEDALKQAESDAAVTPQDRQQGETAVRDDGRPNSLDDRVSYPRSPREPASSASTPNAVSGRSVQEMTGVGIVVGAVATVAIMAMIARQWPGTPVMLPRAAPTNPAGLASPQEVSTQRPPNTTGTLLESTATRGTPQGNIDQRDANRTNPGTADTTARSAGDASPFSLTGVMLGRNQAVAIVNGVMVRVGQRVGGAEVVAIQATAVRLRKDGREFELLLDLASGG